MKDTEEQSTGTPRRDMSARWWRQFGFWGLTLNAVLGFPILVVGSMLRSSWEIDALIGVYASILAAWVASAGIRQWGKNRGEDL